ncbi:MAG TPA: hypothetical protein VFF47_00995 [Nitrospirota bacterium]|nr:hypothetical protein [Nitrospirota bacterium]
MSWRYAVDADIEKADDYSAASAREIDTKKVFLYPEWDYRKGTYKPDASRLSEFIAAGAGAQAVDAILMLQHSRAGSWTGIL